MPRESTLRFTTPKLERFVFEDNLGDRVDGVAPNLEMSLRLKKVGSNQVTEILTAFIGEKQGPYELQISMSADFFLDSVEDEHQAELLQINAPALIFSYIRPLVSQLTASSKYETVTLPFLNFAEHPLNVNDSSKTSY